MAVNIKVLSDLHADNRAIYLPAISKSFAASALATSFASHKAGLTPRDMDFLDPTNKRFHYPYALYSAGQHNTKAAPTPDMVSQRDRNATVILGDSGGYQVSTTDGYFTPDLVLRNMRWMEQVSDFSMVLDFPTGGIESGKMRQHVERLNADGSLDALNAANRLGLDYHACLEQTKLNNDAFIANHAPGATAFLNVLQGRSEKESAHWYQSVKHYPFAGWAFAGHHQNRFSLLLARLIDMRDDGLLGQIEWVHVLGQSTLPLGVCLTEVQRRVRELYAPNFQISFDTASPFLMGANNSMYAGFTLDKHGWSIQNVPLTQVTGYSEDTRLERVLTDALERATRGPERKRYVSRTNVAQRLSLGDLRVPDTADPSKFRLTTDGYNLLMWHNVEALVDAHEEAHQLIHGPAFVRDPVYPVSIHWLRTLIREILEMPTAEAYATIREFEDRLDVLRSEV